MKYRISSVRILRQGMVRLCAVAAAVLLAGAAQTWGGETINYPGATLQSDVYYLAGLGVDSLFPTASVTGNIMTLTSGSISGAAYVGVTNGAETVSGNTLNITGASLMLGIGGHSKGGDATDNTIYINVGADISGGVMAGSSETGNVLRNIVNMNNGTVAEIGAGNTNFGNAQYNEIVMTTGTVDVSVTGGSVMGIGNATNNTVTINGGSIGSFAAAGFIYTQGDAADNVLTFNGGSLSSANQGFMAGGYTSNGAARNNVTTIAGGSVSGAYDYDDFGNPSGPLIPRGIYGGSTLKGDTEGNELNISGVSTTLDGIVAAGRTEEGNATGNKLTFKEATLQGTGGSGDPAPFLGGGFSRKGNAVGNELHIISGTVASGMGDAYFTDDMYYGNYGGATIHGDATDNSIVIDGGTVSGDTAAGVAIYGHTLRNSITVNGGNISDVIAGGYTIAGNSDYNTVTVNGGTFADTDEGIGGGITADGSASHNTVTINAAGSYLGKTVTGGYGMGGLFLEQTLESRADNNIVNFIDGNLGTGGSALVAGGLNWNGGVSNNRVTVSGGVISAGDDEDALGVYGGMTYNGDAIGNELVVQGGTVSGSLAAGHVAENTDPSLASLFPNGTGFGNAVSNTLRITQTADIDDGNVSAGATVNGDAVGNRLLMDGGTVLTNSALTAAVVNGTGNTRNNLVEISGGTVTGTVFGGLVATSGEASGNTVVISGNARVEENTGAGFMPQFIAGGVLMGNGSANNNTVRIAGNADVSTMALYGGYDFLGAGNDVTTGNTLSIERMGAHAVSVANFGNYAFVLPQTGALSGPMLSLDNTADLTGTSISIDAGDRQFAAGDSFVLIDNAAGLGSASVTVYAAVGLGMMNVFDVSESGQLQARFRAFTANPQTKALAESRMAGLSFLNHGSNMIFGSGLDAGLASRAAAGGAGGWIPFAAADGASIRTKTGSHVDVDGFSLMAGLSREICSPFGSALVSGFFESGWGNYDSVNDFVNMNAVYGDGDTNYYGGGLMAYFDLPAQFYGKVAARGGWMESDYSGRNFLSGDASYDSNAAYFGAQAVLGHIWHLGETFDLDTSAGYFWNHQAGDTANVGGDRLRLESTDSQRARGSIRLSYSPNKCFTAYAGAGYEYEFDGKAQAKLNGNAVTPPELRGGTGIGELGVQFRPASDNGFTIGASVQGYVGRNEGVSGGLRFGWSF